ncbi:MAG: polysialyltransferase family glycosyltransferase [Sediminicola sp.]
MISENFKVLDLSNLYHYLETNSKLNKLINIKSYICQNDRKICSLVGSISFTLYIPQFNHSIFQILASHSLCIGTVLIEEGITSYSNNENLYMKKKKNFLFSLFTKRFLLGNNHYYPFPEEKFLFALCMDEDCFPFLHFSRKVFIDVKRESFSEYQSKIEKKGIIFLLDSFKERTGIDNRTYLSVVESTLNIMRERDDSLFVKFHPEQSASSRESTISFILNNFQFKEVSILNEDCILELEFLKHKDLTVLGMHTSLLYYAKKMGHNVYSSMKLTSKIPRINQYIDHIMDKKQKERYLNYE